MTTTLTTPPDDDVKAIRDALALGPTPGIRKPRIDGVFIGRYRLCEPNAAISAGLLQEQELKKANREFIAACYPERIARLLARLEQAERQKTSFRVLLAVTAEKNRMKAALDLACGYLTDEQVELIKAAMPNNQQGGNYANLA